MIPPKLKDVTAELERFKRPIVVHMEVGTAIAVIGAIQLAARHPGRPKRETEEVRFAKQLEAALQCVGPATSALMHLGWNPEHDYVHPIAE